MDRVVRRFVARNPDLFGGSPMLETVRIQRMRRVWYAHYRQTVRGVPVLFEDWEFRVGVNGHLVMFGADAHRVPETAPTRAVIVGAAAREAAEAGCG